jgi:hypothetical protein
MLYRERIFPTVGVTSALFALVLSTSFAVWAALETVAAVSFASLATLFAILWWRSAIHRVIFDGTLLSVNDAKIEIKFIARISALDEKSWQRSRGVDFDPDFFHFHRFWMKKGVTIEITDSRDPHTGWLVGSKNPEELAKVIAARVNRIQ